MRLFILILFSLSCTTAKKFQVEECTTENGAKGFCRPEKYCVGYKQPLTVSGCSQKNTVCCPRRKISEKKCEEYKKKVDYFRGKGACNGGGQPQIIGGNPAQEGEFTHMAALATGFRPDLKWVCGGSLISELYVLTASHCFLGEEVTYIKLGARELNEEGNYVRHRQVDKIIMHPRFGGRNNHKNDIGLIKMNKPVEFTPHLYPICLDFTGTNIEDFQVATGWGFSTAEEDEMSNVLLKVELELRPDNAECGVFYSTLYRSGIVPDHIICLGKEAGKDTCKGDSGGPIHNRRPIAGSCVYMQNGLTFYGDICGSERPSLYTRVWSFVPWIESQVWPEDTD